MRFVTSLLPILAWRLGVAVQLATCILPATAAESRPGLVDHHQHLFSPEIVSGSSNLKVVAADDLLRLMDEAGVARAVVLSTAYQFGNPNKPPVENEYARVMQENDWTATQASRSGGRLIAMCSFNPLKDYALAELERCARDRHFGRGIKLHFGNSDIQLEEVTHLAALRKIFSAANRHRMAIIVHMRPSVSRQRPYGAEQARVFLEKLLDAAPDVAVQIAHLAGAGGYEDPAIDEALGVFVRAIAEKDPRVTRLLFDVSGVVGVGNWSPHAETIANRLRALGLERVLYGSDGAVGDEGTPEARHDFFRMLPMTAAEFARIEGNSAPYLR